MTSALLLKKAISKAKQGSRNSTGLWLACQLRDNGYSLTEAEPVMFEYAGQVAGSGTKTYTKNEAIASLKSAYSRPSRTKGTGGYRSNGRGCQPVNPPQNHVQNGLTSTLSEGVNLASLAEAKHLPVDFLKSLGISDFKLGGKPVVRIPYYTQDGEETAVRIRLALSGDMRFKWRKGDHALPYGLNRIEKIRKAGWVLIVEGESDCWTCWYYDIPALGAPGKSVWPIAWGEYLKELDVYVWQEPEAQDFILRILASTPDLRFIPSPEGIKDVSEAHIQGIALPAWLEELKAQAKSGQELKARLSNVELAKAYAEARIIIEAEDPFELLKTAIRELGYGGDLKPVLIVYLAATSRLLEMRAGAMPVHLLIIGPPSSGKNYTLSCVIKLLPPEACHIIDAGSPRTMIYDDAPLNHRVLVFTEADSLPAGEDNPVASAVRNLLQDHCLHYAVTIRDAATGDFIVRDVSKQGPTTLITTSTQPLGSQLMTRLFTLEISDSKEQISAALATQASIEIEGIKLPDAKLIAFQKYLQLKAPFKVVVPFAVELSSAMAKSASASRILRDYSRLISLIKAVALIRAHSRILNQSGQIVATYADYETVRELVNDMYIDSSTGITDQLRSLVEAAITLHKNRSEGKGITNTTLAKCLNIGIKQVTRQAKKAIRQGWLINREQRKSYPADYEPGEPLPEVEGLPVLREVAPVATVDSERVNPSSFKNEGVDRLTPSTDSNIPPTPEKEESISIPGWKTEL